MDKVLIAPIKTTPFPIYVFALASREESTRASYKTPSRDWLSSLFGRYLSECGWLMREGTIVNATIVAAPASSLFVGMPVTN